MAVIADADYAFGSNENIDIVTRYIGVEGANWVQRATEDIGYNWATQLVMQKEEHWEFSFSLRRPMSVAKDNKIYVLVLNYKKDKRERNLSKYLDWRFELAVGEVKPTGGSPGTGKTIVWRTLVTLSKLTQQLKDNSVNVPQDGDSYSFLANDGKFVFVMQALKEHKFVSVIIHLNDTETGIKTDWSYVETGEGCSFPSFFLWGGKLTMVPHCLDGTYKMKESADMGRTWANATWLPARLWGNLKERGHFTSATIENKTALLFTQPVQTKPNFMWYDIHLWVAFNNRAFDLGPVLVGIGSSIKFVDSARLFYTNGKLIALCLSRTWGPWETGIYFQPLKYEVERIKSVLKAWAETDKYLSKPCVETVPLDAPSGIFCVTPMPTEGLAGFLSNHACGGVWLDEYPFMDATVIGGRRIKNGFTLRGTGSRAKWPVGKQDPDQRHNFARDGLTVVATVTIQEIPTDDDSPLLTFNEFGDKELLGLWYNKNKTWRVVSQEGGASFVGAWEKKQAHRVALVLLQNSFFVYVDGNILAGLLGKPIPRERAFNIEHIFIGGYGDNNVNSTVTCLKVTNVLLYNRLFSESELRALDSRVECPPNEMIGLFAPFITMLPKKVGNTNTVAYVRAFKSPFLVATDGVMVAFAEAFYAYGSKVNNDIAARYIETEGTNWADKAAKNEGSEWKTQLAMQLKGVDYISQLSKPLAVGKGNKIYLIAVNHAREKTPLSKWFSTGWDFVVAVAEINANSGVQGGRTITWQSFQWLDFTFVQQFKSKSKNIISYGGSAFLTKGGDVVFVVKGKGEDKYISAILQLKDTGKGDFKYEWSFVESDPDCHFPSFFEWEEKLVMIPNCTSSRHNVKESIDMGKTWADVIGPFAQMSDSLEGKQDFTVASIDNATLLLYTEQVDKGTGAGEVKETRLFFTDGYSQGNLGSIFADKNDIIFSGLLYTKSELFSLHQEWNNIGSTNILFTHLKGKVEQIRDVLSIWKN